jgi:hypothetical protein
MGDKKVNQAQKIDPGTVARQQLANRFRRTINASLFSSNDVQGEEKVENKEFSNASETLVNSETLEKKIIGKAQDLNFQMTSPQNPTSETRVASETFTSEKLAASEIATSETKVTSETLNSEALATSETLADNLEEKIQNNVSKTLVTSETLTDKTLVTSETLADKTLATSKTLVSFNYGEKIPDSLLWLVLDYGFYDLLGDQVSAAPIIFYWAFTTQQSTVLRIIYKEVQKALNWPPSRIARAIDRIRTSDNFEVKNLKEGLFIDLSRLVKKVQELHPNLTSETLVWRSISLIDLRVLADLMNSYRFTKKDLSLKLVYAMAQNYSDHEKQLKNIALNLSYASKHASGSSSAKLSYLIKALKEDWGGTTMSFDDIEKTVEVISTYKIIREQKIMDLATAELRRILQKFGRLTPDSITREECLKHMEGILSRSDELYEALRQLSGRSKEQENQFFNPSTTNFL